MDRQAHPSDSLIADRFVLKKIVSQGGMGTVHQALDTRTNALVALKILHIGAHVAPEAERFDREARTLARLQHPHVVGYIDHGITPNGFHYLAMEWLTGEDLSRVLGRKRLSIQDCKTLMEPIAQTLAYIHSHHIIHRDLKPANIFLRNGDLGDPVLLDFGIARSVVLSLKLTNTGIAMGTPNYMAPEQVRGEDHILPAADIFSLGCVLFECLTGEPPFKAGFLEAVLAKILFDLPKPLYQLRPGIPPEWCALITRMLSKDLRSRPKDGSALTAELAILPVHSATFAETIASSFPPAGVSSPEAEQVLVSVVLLSSAQPTAPVSREEIPPSSLDSLKLEMSRFGAAMEHTADGSIIASIVSRGSAADQARMAARCALLLHGLRPQLHIAVATGRGHLEGGMPVGEAVSRAAQLLRGGPEPTENGSPGIWLDETTAGLLDARFELKRISRGILLLGEDPDRDQARLLLGRPTPCVGREHELVQLEALLAGCLENESAHAVLLTAAAGTGKSRIRHEFLRQTSEKHPDVHVISAVGDPLSSGSPYGLLAQALRRYADIHPEDTPQEQRNAVIHRLCRFLDPGLQDSAGEFLGELCSIPFSAEHSPHLLSARQDPKVMSEQIGRAFMEWIRAECRQAPMILVLEDLQWGDAPTIQVLDRVLRDGGNIPLLIFALARPELSEIHPKPWSGHVQEIALRPLSKKACERLVKDVLGEKALSAETMARLIARSAGNALFMEELIRAAAEGRTEELPDTVVAMLQARLSRLPPEVRALIRNASIMGEIFRLDAVSYLAEDTMQEAATRKGLEFLIQSEWIEPIPRRTYAQNNIEYRFRHTAVRDAAYALITDAQRVSAHKRALQYLVNKGESDAMLLAEHAFRANELEQAVGFYAQAAEHSLTCNDMAEALRRATLGADAGAEGERLGWLRAIQSLASYGLGRWKKMEMFGAQAIRLLPRGHVYWYRVSESLLRYYPAVERLERFQEVAADVEAAEPMANATSAQVCTLAVLTASFGFMGDRAQSEKHLARVAQCTLPPDDLYSQGMVNFHLSWFGYFFQPDPYQPIVLGRKSVQIFSDARVLHLLGLSHLITGASLAAVGDYEGAIQCFQRGMDLAKESRDDFMPSRTIQAYWSLLLSRVGTPAEFPMAKERIQSVLQNPPTHAHEALARVASAYIHLRSGELGEAEREAKKAVACGFSVPAFAPLVLAALIDVWMHEGRYGEALSEAAKGFVLLERTGGVGAHELPFRAAASELLFSAGEVEEGRRALRETLEQIRLRAGRIEEPFLKDCYLHQNIDNLRAFRLARQWLSEEAVPKG